MRTDSYLKHRSESIPTGTLVAQYPRATRLNLPVIDAGPGFDVNDLKKKLGATRFNALIAGLKRQFVCSHATDASGNEIPCVYAEDVEKFLHEEGNSWHRD